MQITNFNLFVDKCNKIYICTYQVYEKQYFDNRSDILVFIEIKLNSVLIIKVYFKLLLNFNIINRFNVWNVKLNVFQNFFTQTLNAISQHFVFCRYPVFV